MNTVKSTIKRAFGAHYSPDTGSTWIEITEDISAWSMGDGHLRLLVDLPDADDY